MISTDTPNANNKMPVAAGRQSLVQRLTFSSEFGLVLLIALAGVIFASHDWPCHDGRHRFRRA
jgi:hypothetical protein